MFIDKQNSSENRNMALKPNKTEFPIPLDEIIRVNTSMMINNKVTLERF